MILAAPAPRLRCEWPLEDANDRPCGAPASWETDDLGEFHHLCESCCRDAFRMNAFRVESVDA